MNSVVITKRGHIAFQQIPMPDVNSLKKNQVLVKVEAAAINHSDILFMRGKYNIKHGLPFTPGWEGSGTIVGCSPGMDQQMSQNLMGKRVAFQKQGEIIEYKYGGSMADYIVTNTSYIMPIPENIDFDHASSFFINPLTAIGMVSRVKELKAKSCIVTAAASQIGRMIVRLMVKEGITPICIVRRQE